jgi:hypothetical protein
MALKCLSSSEILRSFHVLPPSVVSRNAPYAPTAMPRCASRNATSRSGRASFGAEYCCVQLSPPSVVARITESCPTAQPAFASTKRTAVSNGAAGALARFHALPSAEWST